MVRVGNALCTCSRGSLAFPIFIGLKSASGSRRLALPAARPVALPRAGLSSSSSFASSLTCSAGGGRSDRVQEPALDGSQRLRSGLLHGWRGKLLNLGRRRSRRRGRRGEGGGGGPSSCDVRAAPTAPSARQSPAPLLACNTRPRRSPLASAPAPTFFPASAPAFVQDTPRPSLWPRRRKRLLPSTCRVQVVHQSLAICLLPR